MTRWASFAKYHKTLGEIIVAYRATLPCHTGDGLMLLLNAPLPRAAPALLAARMAVDMQNAFQKQEL